MDTPTLVCHYQKGTLVPLEHRVFRESKGTLVPLVLLEHRVFRESKGTLVPLEHRVFRESKGTLVPLVPTGRSGLTEQTVRTGPMVFRESKGTLVPLVPTVSTGLTEQTVRTGPMVPTGLMVPLGSEESVESAEKQA
jgi:hypothetical protein